MNEPPITVTKQDVEQLNALMEDPSVSSLPGVDLLAHELNRATVVCSKEISPDVVTMNSTVRFVDEVGYKAYELKLVYPHQAGEFGAISILAPVGSALLGLSVGQTIRWPAPGGRELQLRVVSVIDQPESQGRIE